KEFKLIFSNITLYDFSQSRDIKNYISRITEVCNEYINTLSIHSILDLFTSLIEENRPPTQKHYTPHEIVTFMGNIIQAQKGESFFDPACGSGEFISEIIKNQVAISGSEYDVDRLKISKMKMLVNDLSPSNISPSYFTEGHNLKKNFDIILSNPPFSLKIPFDMEMHFCMYGKPPASNADFAFLQYCIFMLKDNGRAAIILPDGILFREGKEYEIRKKIIKNNHISAIIYLPKGIFKTTAIATNIIVFKKKQKTNDILMINVRKKNNLNVNLLLELITKRSTTEISRLTSLNEISAHDYNLSASLYFRPQVKKTDLKQLIMKQKELEEKLHSLQYAFQHKLTSLNL
ncbi:TPA: class I SAM-dependent DNA methyltransferase, partial [Salmonella enterica subsp. enterica serovar Enteritidis]